MDRKKKKKHDQNQYSANAPVSGSIDNRYLTAMLLLWKYVVFVNNTLIKLLEEVQKISVTLQSGALNWMLNKIGCLSALSGNNECILMTKNQL